MSSAVALVETFLEHLRQGPIDRAIEMLAPDFVVDEARSLSFGGSRVGPDGFRSMLEDLLREYSVRLGDPIVRDGGDVVLVEVPVTLRGKESGETTDQTVLDLYTVADGRITRLDVFYKDTASVVAIGANHQDREGIPS